MRLPATSRWEMHVLSASCIRRNSTSYTDMFQVVSATSADIVTTEAEAATEANVYAVIVDRPGNAPLSDESKAKFAVIDKLTDLP